MFSRKNRHARFTRRLMGIAAICALTCATAATAFAATTVKFGVPSWPGEQVKAQVASEILNSLGYKTKISNVSWIIALRSVASGELSADMALWRPTQNSVLNPMLKSGKVTLLTKNITNAQYDLVVPDYVWDAGVHSIADLAKFKDKFKGTIYGIEAGNDGNQLVKDAIKDDLYGLKGFKLVPSSTAGMLSQAGNMIKQKKWVVFLGWKPHWMNIIYDLKYLKDPKEMWGGSSTVNTVVRPDYIEKHPNVTRFLKQMKIPAKVQSQWIFDYGYKEKPVEKVAHAWIASNKDLVEKWLDGVKTANGKQAGMDAVNASFK